MDALLRRRAMIAAGVSPTPPEPPTPEGVVFYDYLVFDGTAYIDTGITPTSDASFVVSLGNETAKSVQRVFVTPGTSSANFGIIYNNNTNSSSRAINIYYGNSSAAKTGQSLSFTNTEYDFFLTPKRFGWGNTAYSITKGSATPNGGVVLGSNPAHSGNPYTGTMKTFKIYGSDAQNVTSFSGFGSYTPVVTLRPCTYNDVPGMWYVEGNSFCGNSAGSGTLTVRNA